jgi:hypothetical protein
MNLLKRLRGRLARAHQAQAPMFNPSAVPPAHVDEVKAPAPYHAEQALAWTPEIAQHNRFVAACAAAKLMRVFTELQGGQIRQPHETVVSRMVDVERARLLALHVNEDGTWRVVKYLDVERAARDTAYWQIAEQICWHESQSDNVTNLQPKLPELTPQESAEAREVSRLRAEVQRIEQQRSPDPEPFTYPSEAEILRAAGGDAGRAAQLRSKIDELFKVADATHEDEAEELW